MKESFLKEAYKEVALYRKKIEKRDIDGSELEQFPILTKEELVGHEGEMIPPRYIMDFYNGNLTDAHTSGSTGKCLEVYWRVSDTRRSMYPLWFYRRKYYGIEPWDKKCQFYTTEQNENEKAGIRNRPYGLDFSKVNLTEQRLYQIYQQMLEYQPVWLLLQPCIAELLCQTKERYQLPDITSLRYIEMTGEMLYHNLRKRLIDNFHVAVANQYGMNEVNSIAYECPNGNLHCMEENVYIEILDDKQKRVKNESIGDIYVTTKTNKVMPFIRYRTGDRGRLCLNCCSCGMKGKILVLEEGRENDWIRMRSGERLTAYVFVRAIEVVNEMTDNSILQFQIIQKDFDNFLIRFATNRWKKEYETMFVRQLAQDELLKAKFEFRIERNLFPEETGKRRFFLSMME